MNKRHSAWAVMLVLSFAIAPTSTAGLESATRAPQIFYLDPTRVDLAQVLAPPPAPDSPAGKADLESVLDAQRTRTPAQIAGAQADNLTSVFRFADVMGPAFTAAKLPFTTAFFGRISSDDITAIRIAKAHFNRPRPYISDPDVKPVVREPANASYPSGHATFAYVDGILLAYMVPEKAAAIFDRAQVFARNRVIAGVHYPSDVEAGRICAAVIDNVLLHDARFIADLATARAEVRHALGLN